MIGNEIEVYLGSDLVVKLRKLPVGFVELDSDGGSNFNGGVRRWGEGGNLGGGFGSEAGSEVVGGRNLGKVGDTVERDGVGSVGIEGETGVKN